MYVYIYNIYIVYTTYTNRSNAKIYIHINKYEYAHACTNLLLRFVLIFLHIAREKGRFRSFRRVRVPRGCSSSCVNLYVCMSHSMSVQFFFLWIHFPCRSVSFYNIKSGKHMSMPYMSCTFLFVFLTHNTSTGGIFLGAHTHIRTHTRTHTHTHTH